MENYDLIVIGAGSGLNIVSTAVELGKKTAIIEEGSMGGTCLNRGCIPSKMIIHSADIANTIRNSWKFGVYSQINKIDLKKVTERASKAVDSEAKEIENWYTKQRNPKFYKGTARFTGYKTLEINGFKIKGKKIVIASGARPSIPLIEGIDKVPYITSKEALRLTKIPKSMIIIGGGYIGAELGYFYAEMGCKITILQRNDLLIPNEDEEVAELFTKLWKRKHNSVNVTVLTSSNAVKVEVNGGKVVVYAENAETKRAAKKGDARNLVTKKKLVTRKIEADKLLIASGLTPNTDILNVKATGVKINKKGYVEVDKYLETNVKGIYAFGDVVGKYMFKHSANMESEYVMNNLYHRKRIVDYTAMPHAIFTNPQIAGVGLTEQEARKKNKNYAIAKYKYADTGMGLALDEKDGFVKYIIDKKTRKILGCHIIGPQASAIIHEVVVVMKNNGNINMISDSVHIHPSLSEVLQRAL